MQVLVDRFIVDPPVQQINSSTNHPLTQHLHKIYKVSIVGSKHACKTCSISYLSALRSECKALSAPLLLWKHFGAVKYISGSKKMSAVWRVFDLGDEMCQLCKAGASGDVESRRELTCEGLLL